MNHAQESLLAAAIAELFESAHDAQSYAVVYGGFHGGDPRDFTPDPDCSTEKERENHRLACAAWERGERPTFKDRCGFQKVMDGDLPPDASLDERVAASELGSSFGLGTNVDRRAQDESERLYTLGNALMRDFALPREALEAAQKELAAIREKR